MPQTFRLSVNGDMREVSVEADTPLLYILRNDLELNGAKFGCGLAQCGACTVIMDGAAIRSCRPPISAAKRSVPTLEGLGPDENPHPLHNPFIAHHPTHCAYSLTG